MTILDYIKIPFYWLFKIIYGIFFVIHWLLDKAGFGICWFMTNVVLMLLSAFFRFIGRWILKFFELIKNTFNWVLEHIELNDNSTGMYEN